MRHRCRRQQQPQPQQPYQQQQYIFVVQRRTRILRVHVIALVRLQGDDLRRYGVDDVRWRGRSGNRL